jgi:hypothetical protein
VTKREGCTRRTNFVAEELDLLRVADTLLLVPHALAGADARLVMQAAGAVISVTRSHVPSEPAHETGPRPLARVIALRRRQHNYACERGRFKLGEYLWVAASALVADVRDRWRCVATLLSPLLRRRRVLRDLHRARAPHSAAGEEQGAIVHNCATVD